jgi:hypothetical protein
MVLSTGAARRAILPIARPARRIKLPRKNILLPSSLSAADMGEPTHMSRLATWSSVSQITG